MSRALLGLGALLLLGTPATIAQAPGAPPAPKQEPAPERDRLIRQVDEFRRASKYDEAVPVAERVLELERGLGDGTTAGVAEALARLAELHELGGVWAKALERRKEALAVRQRVDGKDHWRTADARLALAFAGKVAGFGKADQAKIRAALRKEQEAARLEAQRKYAEAERAALDALETYRVLVGPETVEVARTWYRIGRARPLRNDVRGAKEANEQALAIFRKALPPGHPTIAVSLNNLGNMQAELGDYAQSRANYEEALAIERRALPPVHAEIARSLNNLGNVQFELGDYAAAKASHEEVLAIFRKVLPPGHPDIASSLSNLGSVQHGLREYNSAKARHEEALDIRRKALPPGHPKIAASLNNLGVVQHDLREYAAAKASHEEALAIKRKALPPGHPEIAYSLSNLGLVQHDLQENAAAKASHEEALAIWRKVLPPGHPRIAASLNNLGNVQRELREYAAAKRSYEEALAIHRKALPKDHPDIASNLNNLGVVQWVMREFTAAKMSHEEALAIRRKALPKDHPDIAHSLNNLGNVQYDLREYAAARQSHEEALTILRNALPPGHPDIAASLANLAWVGLAAGVDVGDAVPRFAEATDILQRDQLRLAVAQAEPEQLATAAGAQLKLHSLIDATLTTRAGPGPTYDRVVRGKGSVTAQQRWARQARDAADPETARLLDRLGQVTQQIVGLSVSERSSDPSSDPQGLPALLRALSAERARLEQQLTERSAVYRAIQARARVGGGDVEAALPKGAALIDLVEYLHQEFAPKGKKEASQEQRLAAFVVRPDQDVVIVPLGPTQPLAEVIDRWRVSSGAGTAPPAGAPDPGAELRKRLWEPLAKHLEGIRVVLVSPDGPLNGLPLAALPGSKKGTFLIHEYAFAVVAVPQLLPELLRDEPGRAKEPPSLLLAGGIDFGAETARHAGTASGKLPPVPFFSPLAGAEREVSDLRAQFAHAFPAAPAPAVLRQDRATKPAILAAAPAHPFVHLATHGFFAGEAEESAVAVAQRAERLRGGMRFRPEATGRHPGLLSGLVFAGVNRPDRTPEQTILTALEAAELELGKVELVVLSACDTGRGQVAGGEGVLGLQRAFQLAGARAVVASLWKVPDAATRVLMAEFYQNLWEKKLPKLEALRQAQLTLLRDYRPGAQEGRGGRVKEVDRRVEELPEKRPAVGEGERLPPFYWAAFVLSGDWR
jgi:CHAT domain-containing protein/tetratricopeptide (TPR) repeat protein